MDNKVNRDDQIYISFFHQGNLPVSKKIKLMKYGNGDHLRNLSEREVYRCLSYFVDPKKTERYLFDIMFNF